MSSLLDEAIVDAKALREAVLKNAEASLLEAYAPKIEEAVASLLEQEAAGMGMPGLPGDVGAPPPDIGAPPGGLGLAEEDEGAESPSMFPKGKEEQGLNDIKLAALTELDGEVQIDEEVEVNITRGELQAMLESITRDIDSLEEDMEENYTITEDDIDLLEQETEDEEQDFSDIDLAMSKTGGILPGEASFYTVKAGDTLGAIAIDNGITVEDIMNSPHNEEIKDEDDET